MTERNWHPARVRRNFHIDVFSGACAGIFSAVLVTFMPVVVRRMGGTPMDVAIVVGAPFVGHMLAPFFTLFLARFRPVRVVAGTSTLARLAFILGVLVASTPLMFALSTVAFWVITVSNVAVYTSLMRAIYPDSDRAYILGKVRVGASIAGIASSAVAGVFIDSVPVQWVFLTAALVALPGSVAFFKVHYERAPVAPRARPVNVIVRDVWSDARYRRLLLAFMVFGWGNLMNFAVFPIMLVDHFDAPNTFVGIFAAAQSATMVVAYIVVGRLIDRGSSLRQTMISTVLVLLMPIGYIVAPGYLFLLPVAIVGGITAASGELTYYTNVVQLAPRDRIAEYTSAQSLLLGLRGTFAPFAASALLGVLEPRAVLGIGLAFMVTGAFILSGVVREPVRVAPIEPVAAPAS